MIGDLTLAAADADTNRPVPVLRSGRLFTRALRELDRVSFATGSQLTVI